MIKLSSKETNVVEISDNSPKQNVVQEKIVKDNNTHETREFTTNRPDIVDAKVYKVKSSFVKNSVFVTLGYISENGKKRPFEIFINSKDLTRAPEYVVLTRLISAIFRRTDDPMFILEELRGIFDPSGGFFKEGKYMHSFYAEVADVIERFFFDVGIVEKPDLLPKQDNGMIESTPILSNDEGNLGNLQFKICPECSNRTLKMEAGCDVCVGSDCGYSKCDK
tara:strand:- start:152 stop:817 length:666 start_codon:yes stop_codon:yes gene_type:complete